MDIDCGPAREHHRQERREREAPDAERDRQHDDAAERAAGIACGMTDGGGEVGMSKADIFSAPANAD